MLIDAWEGRISDLSADRIACSGRDDEIVVYILDSLSISKCQGCTDYLSSFEFFAFWAFLEELKLKTPLLRL